MESTRRHPHDQVIIIIFHLIDDESRHVLNCLNHILDRSTWYSNKHFRGSYSSRTLKAVAAKVSASTLSHPVNNKNGIPVKNRVHWWYKNEYPYLYVTSSLLRLGSIICWRSHQFTLLFHRTRGRWKWMERSRPTDSIRQNGSGNSARQTSPSFLVSYICDILVVIHMLPRSSVYRLETCYWIFNQNTYSNKKRWGETLASVYDRAKHLHSRMTLIHFLSKKINISKYFWQARNRRCKSTKIKYTVFRRMWRTKIRHFIRQVFMRNSFSHFSVPSYAKSADKEFEGRRRPDSYFTSETRKWAVISLLSSFR